MFSFMIAGSSPQRKSYSEEKSTIEPLISSPIAYLNPITDLVLALNLSGSAEGLLLLARDNDWSTVIVALLIVLTVRAIAKMKDS
jgi:hypothetical protein